MHAVITRTHPAGARPDVTIFITPNPIRLTCLYDLLHQTIGILFFHFQVHARKDFAVLKAGTVGYIPDLNFFFGFRVVR